MHLQKLPGWELSWDKEASPLPAVEAGGGEGSGGTAWDMFLGKINWRVQQFQEQCYPGLIAGRTGRHSHMWYGGIR